MNLKNKLINKLKSPNHILIALVLALIVQSSHSVFAYMNVIEGRYEGFLFWFNLLIGSAFAIAISWSILLHTVHKVQWVAFVYLFVETIINLVYYEILDESLKITQVIPMILFSLFLPFTISRYAFLMKRLDTEEEVFEPSQINELTQRLEKLETGGEYSMQLNDKFYTVKLQKNEV